MVCSLDDLVGRDRDCLPARARMKRYGHFFLDGIRAGMERTEAQEYATELRALRRQRTQALFDALDAIERWADDRTGERRMDMVMAIQTYAIAAAEEAKARV